MYVSIEGLALEHFSSSNQSISSLTSEEVSIKEFFHSFLSNNIKQDATTAPAHIKLIM